jgi:two-component system, cell cycle response regulator
MSATDDHKDGLLPLAERIRWTGYLRMGVALAPIPLWHLQPEPPLASATAVTVAALAYLVLGVLSAGLERLPRRAARAGLTIGLLLDGLYLAWVFFALSTLQGAGGLLAVIHVVGVTLLMSFRSGTKVAMWHSLLTLFVLQARSDEAFLPLVPEPLQPFPVYGFAIQLGIIWAATLSTATFAAINERELRRRRYDAEALRRFGANLETCYDPARILELLAEFGREELLAARVVGLMGSSEPHEESFDGTTHRPSGDRSELILAEPGARPVPRAAPDLHDESIVYEALRSKETLRCRRVGATDAEWLGSLLPEASNLAVVPLMVEDPYFGALILEYGRPSRWRRTRRLERRLVAAAEQASAQAGLALGRALLMIQLQDAAQTDGLTQIANRAMFDDMLERECDRSLRSGEPTAVALLDLDHFKLLNDTHGHLEGDQALRDVARSLRIVCRQSDLPARYGGEEFAVLLVGAHTEAAATAAERFRKAIEEIDRNAPVTASVGVAVWPHDGITARELVAAADTALYAAKHAGRNRVVISSPQLFGSDVDAPIAPSPEALASTTGPLVETAAPGPERRGSASDRRGTAADRRSDPATPVADRRVDAATPAVAPASPAAGATETDAG